MTAAVKATASRKDTIPPPCRHAGETAINATFAIASTVTTIKIADWALLALIAGSSSSQ